MNNYSGHKIVPVRIDADTLLKIDMLRLARCTRRVQGRSEWIRVAISEALASRDQQPKKPRRKSRT